jgi:hypothetical protein
MQTAHNANGVVMVVAVGANVGCASYYYGYWFSHLRD